MPSFLILGQKHNAGNQRNRGAKENFAGLAAAAAARTEFAFAAASWSVSAKKA